MKVIIKTSCERCPDSRNLLKVGDPGAHDPLQPPEVFQKLASLGRPQARDHLEYRLVIAPCALAAVPGDGKAMGLITDALDET